MGTGTGVVGGYLGFQVCGPACGAWVSTAVSAPFKGLKVLLQAGFNAEEAKHKGANQQQSLAEFGKTVAVEGTVEVVKETIGHVTPGFANLDPKDMVLDTFKEIAIDEAVDALRDVDMKAAAQSVTTPQTKAVDFSLMGGVSSLVDVHAGPTGMPADQMEPAQ